MFVTGLGTSNPPLRDSKAECWAAFQKSRWFGKLDQRARSIAEMVLTRDNGITFHNLAVPGLEQEFAIDPDTLHVRFFENAPQLAAVAGAKALRDAERRSQQHVLSECIEVSSTAMYLANDAGVLISACLFGDGARLAVSMNTPIVLHTPSRDGLSLPLAAAGAEVVAPRRTVARVSLRPRRAAPMSIKNLLAGRWAG